MIDRRTTNLICVVVTIIWALSVVADIIPQFNYEAPGAMYALMTAVITGAGANSIFGGRKPSVKPDESS